MEQDPSQFRSEVQDTTEESLPLPDTEAMVKSYCNAFLNEMAEGFSERTELSQATVETTIREDSIENKPPETAGDTTSDNSGRAELDSIDAVLQNAIREDSSETAPTDVYGQETTQKDFSSMELESIDAAKQNSVQGGSSQKVSIEIIVENTTPEDSSVNAPMDTVAQNIAQEELSRVDSPDTSVQNTMQDNPAEKELIEAAVKNTIHEEGFGEKTSIDTFAYCTTQEEPMEQDPTDASVQNNIQQNFAEKEFLDTIVTNTINEEGSSEKTSTKASIEISSDDSKSFPEHFPQSLPVSFPEPVENLPDHIALGFPSRVKLVEARYSRPRETMHQGLGFDKANAEVYLDNIIKAVSNESFGFSPRFQLYPLSLQNLKLIANLPRISPTKPTKEETLLSTPPD